MKVGIITFHASHNYGSMLQAYALQQTVIALGHECEIINFRTKAQREIYKPFFRQDGWIKKAKALRYPFLAIDDIKKHRLFERFLNHKLILSSATFSSSKELEDAQLDYDCYISGSDQIWNTCCSDFSTAYYLGFVKSGKRIAYAPSMGPSPEQVKDTLDKFISDCISRYDSISVREPGTAEIIKPLTDKKPSVAADPTLLLTPAEWSSLAGETPLINGDYILIYTPWYEYYKNLYGIAARLAEEKGMQVICTLPDGYRYWNQNPYFKFFTVVGPTEFLNLIKHACYVLCGSFHAVVFSMMFGKPFYAYKGMDDSRISHLLKLTENERYAESPDNMSSLGLTNVSDKLKPFIESSRKFLIDSLK